jgi:alpha-galactosidase
MTKCSWRAKLILALLAFLSGAVSAVEPSKQEMAQAWNWHLLNFSLHRSNGKIPPVSFSYGGRPATQLLREWKRHVGPDTRVGDKIDRSLLFIDSVSGLEVELKLTAYRDFPAVEWVVYFRNKGTKPTPILENIQPLDFAADGDECEFVVHYAQGASNQPADFSPIEHLLKSGEPLNLTSVGGSSSHTRAVPFFNIQRRASPEKARNKGEPDGGILIGLGWTGQWSAVFGADSQSLRARAGMERTHLKLLPGESIRTPRMMLLFWQGKDRIRSHNLLRKFLLAHHTPRPGGQLPTVPIAAMPWWQFDYGNSATVENQIETASLYRKRRVPVDTYWLDAGWFEGGWPNGTGNWFPKKDAFPQGLRQS